MKGKRILVVEDEIVVALDIKKKVIRLGHETVDIVTGGEAAIEKVKEIPFDLILMDISLEGDIDGIEAAKRIQSRFDIPIIYLTAHADKDTLERAKTTEPYGYIVKPFDKATLHATIEMTLYKHQLEAKLKEKDENFRNLAENASEGILMATIDGRHVYANRRAGELTGYNASQLIEVYFKELIWADGNKKENENRWNESFFLQKREITVDRNEQGAVTLETAGTGTIWQGRPAVLVLLRDITKLKRAEEERNRLLVYLEQARKLEALGTLSGGIAHNFNNLLCIILGFTELTIAQLPEESLHRASLEKVIQACFRAKDIVKQILNFSNSSHKDLKPVKIIPIVRESFKLLRSSIPANIDVQVDIKTESDVVLADPLQFNQVLLNLCSNAVYAMREAGGILEVVLEGPEIAGNAAVPGLDLKPGHFVRLEIRDTGEGIEPGELNRIFEPFFTTRRVGDGVGMGLAVVHSIIKHHGGAITVQSEPGKGASFRVYLPITQKEVPEDKEMKPTGIIGGGHERILFVDDEEDILDMVKRMLEYLGYRVVTESNGPEALELFKAGPDRFDIVITDMIMPKMTGAKLAREIHKINPHIAVIICTGYSEAACEEEVKAMKAELKSTNIKTILKKPLVIREMAQTIRNILDKNN